MMSKFHYPEHNLFFHLLIPVFINSVEGDIRQARKDELRSNQILQCFTWEVCVTNVMLSFKFTNPYTVHYHMQLIVLFCYDISH